MPYRSIVESPTQAIATWLAGETACAAAAAHWYRRDGLPGLRRYIERYIREAKRGVAVRGALAQWGWLAASGHAEPPDPLVLALRQTNWAYLARCVAPAPRDAGRPHPDYLLDE